MTEEPTFDTFARQLYRAGDFVDVGRAVCAAAWPVFGLHQIVVMLNAPDGRPLISVDTMPIEADATRAAYFAETWKLDPFLSELRTRYVFHEHSTREHGLFTLTLPITALPRIIGVLRCGSLVEYSEEHRRDLTSLATQVSVRLAQLGVTTPSKDEPTARLSARQFATIQLAARGLSNTEIASDLKVSHNTVKKHLQAAFRELGVSNRTELAIRIPRTEARDRVAAGITHLDGCTIVKAK